MSSKHFAHTVFFKYNKDFIGADGKKYHMVAAAAAKHGTDVPKLIANWNRVYLNSASPNPYTFVKYFTEEEALSLADSSGKKFIDKSMQLSEANCCTMIIELVEITN